MRFIHTADIHLGAVPDKGYPWSDARKKEITDTFSELIGVCRREKPDLLLIAGDLFHRQPLVRELKEVDALFASIPSTRVVIIAGNHDFISGVSNYNGFEWSHNVTFFEGEEVGSIYFEDINTEVYGLSFCHRNIREPLLAGVRPVDPGHVNILLAHGGEPGNLPMNFAELTKAGFDYIALGHIHIPGAVAPAIRYPGDLEPLDKNDVGERGYIYGEISSELTLTFVPFSKRQYFKPVLEVDGTITQVQLRAMVRDAIAENGEENIFAFTLKGRRDPDVTFDCEALAAEGNILEINDETVPDFDFDRLMAENRNNIIGQYIETVKRMDAPEKVKDKALEYGVTALLGI